MFRRCASFFALAKKVGLHPPSAIFFYCFSSCGALFPPEEAYLFRRCASFFALAKKVGLHPPSAILFSLIIS